MLGKKIRMERVMDRNTGKTVMVPLIHGVGMGPIEGIRDIKNSVDTVALGGANAVILHKGIVASAHRRSGKDIGLVLNLTATLPMPYNHIEWWVGDGVGRGAQDAYLFSLQAGDLR